MLIEDTFTVVEWITSAIEQFDIPISNAQYLQLTHAIYAENHFNSIVPIDVKVTTEAQLLKMANQYLQALKGLSSTDNLFSTQHYSANSVMY